jgi:PPOX class probable F420-dependent enzyme
MSEEAMRRIGELLADRHGAVLATRNPDGTLDQFFVWAALQDGKLVMTTTTERPKFRNLSHDPRVSLMILPRDNPYAHVEIKGQITISHEGAYEFMQSLCEHYRGEPFNEPSGVGSRVLVTLTPDPD